MPVENGRCYALQFIDLHTLDCAYVGSRTTGNGAGVRLYRPGPEILDGSWTFPQATPMRVKDASRSQLGSRTR